MVDFKNVESRAAAYENKVDSAAEAEINKVTLPVFVKWGVRVLAAAAVITLVLILTHII